MQRDPSMGKSRGEGVLAAARLHACHCVAPGGSVRDRGEDGWADGERWI